MCLTRWWHLSSTNSRTSQSTSTTPYLISLERVMNSAEKPHRNANFSVSSVLRRSPVFRISKLFLSKFIIASRLYRGFGVLFGQNVHDTMLASRVARAGEWEMKKFKVIQKGHSLDDCLERELGIEIPKDTKLKWDGPLQVEHLEYAIDDVAHLKELYEALQEVLNAWCELSIEDLRGRCPRTRVGLLTNPEGKGTDCSCSTWTPSSPHFTSSSMNFATLIKPNGADPVLMPLSVVARSSPSLSSAGGLDSPAKGTSIATPRHILEEHSRPGPTVPSSTGSRDSMQRPSRRSP